MSCLVAAVVVADHGGLRVNSSVYGSGSGLYA